jgi:hypothetical protein
VKQLRAEELRNQQFRDRTIRSAFLGITGALPARPIAMFDNAGRETCPVTPWRKLQEAARAASAEATRIGRPIVVATTRQRITELYELLLADALAPLPQESEVTLVQAAIEETAAQGPADVAVLAVVAKPTCREKLLTLAASARNHARRALSLASVAEHTAHNLPTAGMRQWR